MNQAFFVPFLMTFLLGGLMISVRNRGLDRKTVSRTYNILVLSVLIWSASAAMFFYFRDYSQILFWSKMQLFSGSFMPSSLLLFAFLYPLEKFTIPVYKRFFIFIPNLVHFYLLFYTDLMIKGVGNFNGHLGWTAGPMIAFWHLHYFVFLAWALIRFFKAYKNSIGSIKDRLRYLFFSSLTGIILAAFPCVIMPRLMNEYGLYWMGTPVILCTVWFNAYVIFKKPLMEIPVIVKKGIVFAIIAAIIIFIHFLVEILLKKFFHVVLYQFPLSSYIVSLIVILVSFSPLKNVVSSFVDKYFIGGSYYEVIKENELLKEEVAQTEKYRSLATVFTRIIYEIKNPLTILKGYSYCLEDKYNDRKFLSEFSKTLRTEVDRINKLVNHLTEYSQPSPLSIKDVNICLLIDETLGILKNNFIIEKINLIKKYSQEELTMIPGDPAQLKQAFLNIIVNAIDAMQKGGDLWVGAGIDKDIFKITIRDTGCGISQNDIKKIFDPFFTKKENNYGLGLSVALGIIENHNGSIKIESQESIGTEVIVELPLERLNSVSSDAIKIG